MNSLAGFDDNFNNFFGSVFSFMLFMDSYSTLERMKITDNGEFTLFGYYNLLYLLRLILFVYLAASLSEAFRKSVSVDMKYKKEHEIEQETLVKEDLKKIHKFMKTPFYS